MSSSEIKYLLALKSLDKNDSPIKSVDIANKLHYTRSSVCRMMTKFEQLGLVGRAGKKIVITPKGLSRAKKYRKLIAFLTKEIHTKLNCSYALAQTDALNIVGTLSKRNLENMYVVAIKNQCFFDK